MMTMSPPMLKLCPHSLGEISVWLGSCIDYWGCTICYGNLLSWLWSLINLFSYVLLTPQALHPRLVGRPDPILWRGLARETKGFCVSRQALGRTPHSADLLRGSSREMVSCLPWNQGRLFENVLSASLLFNMTVDCSYRLLSFICLFFYLVLSCWC